MQLGIIGLPQSGKTTLFNALTGAKMPTESTGGHLEVHTATIDVPDARLETLVDIYKPKKVVHAKVTYADIAGIDGKAGKTGLPGALINKMAMMDGFLHVVRQFESPFVAHQDGNIDPIRDIQSMDSEFILNDLIMVERKLERLTEEHRRGVSRPRDEIQAEIDVFKALQSMLSEDLPLRHYKFTPEEARIVASYDFLSRKPQIIVINQSEEQEAPAYQSPHPHTKVIALPAKLEMDIAALEPEDAEIFMEEYGITELALVRLIKLSYELLDVHSFFTAGDKEVHAWTLKNGSNAREAAGVIHSDMEKGFIRAEVISYDDLLQYGSTAEARNKGRLRVEGKQYIVEDGDVIEIRFNI